MKSLLSRAKFRTQPGGRPPSAVELAPEGVLAAVVPAPGKPPEFAFEPLPAGAIVPGIGEPNLRAPEAVANAIRAAFERLAPRSRALTVVVPDPVVRVFVLDFDSLPNKTAEVIPVLRFRLRKMVPFDVEQAGLSYQVLAESKTECKVLAAVLPNAVLQEFEDAARLAGFEPGAVLPSSLAALAGIDSMEAVMAANLSALSLTTTITSGQDMLLYRTLDLPENPDLRIQEVQRGIAVATAYYEDKLSARPGSLLYAGNTPGSDFARWIDDPQLAVVEMATRPEALPFPIPANFSIAGVTGALAGVS